MRVAVIGGAGFIGTHLVQLLLRRKHDVLVYDNLFARRGSAKGLPWLTQTRFVRADILNAAKLTACLRDFQPELLYHLAAIPFIPYCEKHPRSTFRVNVEGTINVMRAAQACETLRGVIFASSSDVYAPDARFHRETDAPRPNNIYGLTKELGERIVLASSRRSRRSCILARIFNVYGPGDTHPHLIPEVIRQIKAGAKVLETGRLDTCRDLVFVEDTVEALLRMAKLVNGKRPRFEALNAGSGEEWPVRTVLETLARLAGVTLRCVPRQSRMRDVDRKHSRCDTRRMHRMLDWKPQYDLVSGLRETLKAG